MKSVECVVVVVLIVQAAVKQIGKEKVFSRCGNSFFNFLIEKYSSFFEVKLTIGHSYAAYDGIRMLFLDGEKGFHIVDREGGNGYVSSQVVHSHKNDDLYRGGS